MKFKDLFYKPKKVALPGPGAEAWVFRRAFYDPLIDPIGPGYGVHRQEQIYEPNPVNMSQSLPQIGLDGVNAGQFVMQPLESTNTTAY